MKFEAEANDVSLEPAQAGLPLLVYKVSQQADIDRIEIKLQNQELQRTQLALKMALDRYRILYEFSPVSYLSLSSDSSVLEINLTGVRLLGVDRKKILHRRFTGFVAPVDVDKCHHFLKMAVGMSDHQAIPLVLQRGDGSRVHVQMDCEPMQLEDESVALRVTLTDISERVRAEEEI